MGIGAAVAASAAAGLAGSAISSGAAQSAASTQASAADQASNNALAQFNTTNANLAPYRGAGNAATNALDVATGYAIPGVANPLTANGLSGLTFQPTQAQLEATPGYQFDLTQGLQATQNANAATGNGVSGAALKGAASYATGLANNTLTTQQGIFQQNLGNVLNPLQNLANLGENAAATTGQQGNQAVANANSALIGGANATAAGTVGSANALSSGLGSLGGAPLNYALYSQLLNSSNDPGSIPGGGTGTVAGGQGGGQLYGNSI